MNAATQRPTIARLGFWPVQHGPVDRDAYTDTDVVRGPVYLSAEDVALIEWHVS